MFILDFEASSLSPDSYPIEVAWGKSKDTVHSRLINPSYINQWVDWDIKSQKIHGIERDILLKEGEPPQKVANDLVTAISGQIVFSDEPRFDSMWKDRLLKDSGFDPNLIIIKDLKTHLITLIHSKSPEKRFYDLLYQFQWKNVIHHRAEADVLWLFDLLNFIQENA